MESVTYTDLNGFAFAGDSASLRDSRYAGIREIPVGPYCSTRMSSKRVGWPE